LAERGLFLREGTIVDATLIAAPPSTKNKKRARDTEMHQTRKGKQWYFGMKVHIGVDAQSGLVHTLIGTAASVHDVTQAQALLHGDESVPRRRTGGEIPSCSYAAQEMRVGPSESPYRRRLQTTYCCCV